MGEVVSLPSLSRVEMGVDEGLDGMGIGIGADFGGALLVVERAAVLTAEGDRGSGVGGAI